MPAQPCLAGRVAACLCAVALAWVPGCGTNPPASHPAVQFGETKRKTKPAPVPQFDRTTVELIQRLPVNSTPADAKRVLGRQPDKTEDDGDNTTAYYCLNRTTRETLRLRYCEGRLIGKELVPHLPESALLPAQSAPDEQPLEEVLK